MRARIAASVIGLITAFFGQWRGVAAVAVALLPGSWMLPAQAQVPLSGVATVAVGGQFSCALTTTGGVKCWGSNGNGSIGDGSYLQRQFAVDVSGLTSGVTVITTGFYHGCALTTGGGIKCWGSNGNGQLGDNSTTVRREPVDVNGFTSGATAVAAGHYHTCAVTTGGGVKCWGNNSNGQLGDNTTAQKLTPVDVVGLASGVLAIAAGASHTCALTTGGGVKCWGANSSGQLGDSTTAQKLVPVDATGLPSGVAAITAGGNHTCVRMTPGGAKCWGANYTGQIGDNTSAQRNQAVDVSGLTTGVAAIEAGYNFTCAVTVGGAAKCWGNNELGPLGDGTNANRLAPVDVTGLASGVAAISGGSTHACAALNGGGVQCWGSNDSDQLGDGTDDAVRVTPVDVGGLGSGMADVAAGFGRTCAITSGGGLKCLGANGSGEVGDGTRTHALTAVNVSGLTSGVLVAGLGRNHSCALVTGGGVKCWGYNANGQLGDNTTTGRPTAAVVSGLASGALAIAAGGQHSCAIASGGVVKCWGANGSGQLGDDTTAQKLVPTDVSGLGSGVLAIVAGNQHTCALTSVGGVKCWGNNANGQLGDDTTAQKLTPVDVSGLTSGVLAIAAGANHTCAKTVGGGLECWGANSSGQLGDTTTTQRTAPVDVSGMLTGVASVDGGDLHTCALMSGGGVKCWGAAWSGQVGDGSLVWGRTAPVDVSGLGSGALAIATGSQHSCALTTGGGIKCWGDNLYGQTTGDGLAGYRPVPANVLMPGPAVTLSVTVNGTGTGTVTSAPAGITCPGTCVFPFPAGPGVVLSANSTGGSVFTGWLGACTGAAGCTVTTDVVKSVSATFAPAGTLASLDIDLSTPDTTYDALTDGLLTIRYLFGLSGPSLIGGALGPNAKRITAAKIGDYLTDIKPVLDVDGNGQADALTDGLLIIRHLFGLRGNPLIAGAVDPLATRKTATEIQDYIQTLRP